MSLRSEDGFGITELLVSMLSALTLMAAIATIMTAALHNQDRIANRVDANQRARPVITGIVQDLHAACVAQRVTPVIGNGSATGSTATRISFLSKSGNAVTPTPDLHVVQLSGTNLTESVYPATAGSQPGPWTFSSTPYTGFNNRTLLANVSAPGGVVFRYFQFANPGGTLSFVPLTSSPGLSATDAAHTAVVDISLAVSPNGVAAHPGASAQDPKSPITMNDSVDLRLEAAGQYPNQDNLPCV